MFAEVWPNFDFFCIFQYFGQVISILQECGDLLFIRYGSVSPLVKLTVGIISGFGKVNAQIFGKSCNCQKTGEIVFWGPNPLNCCTFSKRQLERVLQTSNSKTDKISLFFWVAWLHGPTWVKFSCKRQVASDGLLPFFLSLDSSIRDGQVGSVGQLSPHAYCQIWSPLFLEGIL